MAIKQITSAPSISPEGKSIAKIREIRGKSLVWNQLVQNGNFADGTTRWPIAASMSSVNSGILSVTTPGINGILCSQSISNNGHKFYSSAFVKATTNQVYFRIGNQPAYHSGSGSFERLTILYNGSSNSSNITPQFRDIRTSDYDTVEIKDVILIDLTLMFGAGNEPETGEEFEAMFPENYYEYNSGEIINSNINAIESVGFNQWDEEWEEGYYNQGQKVGSSSSNRIRCKNPIRCLPSTIYKLTTIGEKSNTTFSIDFLDRNGGYISSTNVTNNTFTTPNNCYFFVFATSTTYYGSTYNHDICINLSDANRNGTYEPYKKSTLSLNISTLTGKLNGEGESVVIYSDGLKSAGSVYDYGIVEDGYLTKIVKVIGEVDLGTLSWTSKTLSSNDGYKANLTDGVAVTGSDGKGNAICEKYEVVQNSAVGGSGANKVISVGAYWGTGCGVYLVDSSFSGYTGEQVASALSGIYLYYELATPETYVLDTPILMEYSTDGGTEQIVFSENLLSAPLVADIDYFNNAIKHIQFNDEKHCVRDERITGIDYIPIEHSTNVVTSAGVYNAISEAKAPLQSVSYKSAWLSTSAHTVHFLMNVKPIDWEKVYTVKYRLNCSIEDTTSSNTESLVTLQFTKDTLRAYYVENAVTSTSYKSFYQHYVCPVSDVGFNNGFGAGVGIYIPKSTDSYSYAGSSRYRLIDIDLLEAINCEVELFSEDLDAEDMQLDTSTTHMDYVSISSATGLQETGNANSTYANYSFGNSYGICSTAANTLAKTSEITNYTLSNGAVTTIQFDNDVPANSTLNVTSKGAKPIYYRGAAIVDNVIKAGDVATFRYTTAVASGAYVLVALDRDFNDFVVENKSASLAAAGSSATIATVNGTNITVTTPSSWIVTDTKNTAGSTDTSNKIFLIGATSQDINPQTYSDNEIYATSGVLTTKSVQVGGTAATMQYNSTDSSIEFVFS